MTARTRTRGRAARRYAVSGLAFTIVLAGCSDAAPAGSSSAAPGGSSSTLAVEGTPEGLPANAPARFAFGMAASEARVAAWDIDIRPDGAGLPPGGGTVAQGRAVYNVQCVACHGPTGTEGPNDRLVDSEQWDVTPTSRAIGNYWPYATTLYDYIRKAMPQLTPGILSDDEVYAVIAYLLYLNEIIPEDAVMNAATLPRVDMPARDKFVVDDRTGGSGVVR